MGDTQHFRVCSTCRKEIGFESAYFVCSVSTCNRRRTGLSFCSLACWDAHLPEARHREAWAEERRAPTRAEWARELSAETAHVEAPPRRAAAAPRAAPAAAAAAPAAPTAGPEPPREVLVVVSKLKAYIRARFGMNTSDGVADVLSDRLRRICDEAASRAARDGRKTVLDRDIPRGDT